MIELPLGALRVRGWSKGCDLCWKGGKLVLFVTGECPLYNTCPYCTISTWRREKDIVMVNERMIKSDEDVLEEAILTKAMGAGITGGEPSLKAERVAKYSSMLKERFGPEFHIHVYTNSLGINDKSLKVMREGGVDEIRFHTWDRRSWEKIKLALDYGFIVGAEMPAIPGDRWEKILKELALYLDKIGASFLNLNELEFTPSNRERLLSMGFKPKPDSDVAVSGSREAATRVLQFLERETGIMGYFCPAAQKEYQVRMRWMRRAENVALPYETPTDEGTLIYGEITGPRDELIKLKFRNATLVNDKLLVDADEFIEKIEDIMRAGLDGKLVEVMPTDDRTVLSSYPLDFLLKTKGRSRH